MDIKDSLLQLADKIKKQKVAIQTEEATKNAFIMPMIALLGYDVFDPFEVIPEMDCDLTQRGDKIDYAIMKDGHPILLIECKHCNQRLDVHGTQLSKYYAASNARFGVLTNGIEYRFYADLDKRNIMDEKPFLIVNMLDLSDNDIEQMKKFHKSYYNESEILSTAQELQATIQVKNMMEQIFKQPNDEFVRYFVRNLNDGKSTPKLVEQYRPIVKKSIASIIDDIISDRLNIAAKQTDMVDTTPIDKETNDTMTQEKHDAYNIVKELIGEQGEVSYTNFKGYLLIWTKYECWWVCRISLKPYSKRICFTTENRCGYTWNQIQSVEDIRIYSDEIKNAFNIAKGQRERYLLKKQKTC